MASYPTLNSSAITPNEGRNILSESKGSAASKTSVAMKLTDACLVSDVIAGSFVLDRKHQFLGANFRIKPSWATLATNAPSSV